MMYILSCKLDNGSQYTGLSFAQREVKNIKTIIASSLACGFNIEMDIPKDTDSIFEFNLINPDRTEISEFFHTPEEYVESRKKRRFNYYCIGYLKNNISTIAIIDIKYKRAMIKNFGKYPELELTVGQWL